MQIFFCILRLNFVCVLTPALVSNPFTRDYMLNLLRSFRFVFYVDAFKGICNPTMKAVLCSTPCLNKTIKVVDCSIDKLDP